MLRVRLVQFRVVNCGLAFILAFLWGISARAQVALPRASASTQDFAAESDFANLIAYDRDKSVSVAQRQHPEYEQVGARFGIFDVLPSLGLGLGYEDNIYSAPTHPKSAPFSLVSPNLTVSTTTSSNNAWLNGQMSVKRFWGVSEADENGWRVAGGGRATILRDLILDGEVSTDKKYEESDSVGTPQDAVKPVAVYEPQGYLRATLTNGRFRNALALQAARFSYDDVQTFSGSELDETYRDQNIYRAIQRSEYGLSPEVAIVEAGTFTVTNYDSHAALADKDSRESRILLGIDCDLTNLIRGELAVGYLDRSFSSAQFKSLRGAAALLKLDYFVSPLTTVSMWARRAIDDAALLGVNAFFSNSANLQADHELFRNLVVTAVVTYQLDQYSSSRGSDRSLSEGLHANYLMNRNVRVTMDFDHTNRDTRGIDFAPKYSSTRLLLSFTLLL